MRRISIGIGLLALVAVTAAPALAGFTDVYAPARSGELSHQAIIQGIYGGSFAGSGLNMVGSGASSGIVATRMEDFGAGGPMNLVSGGAGFDDQMWTDGIAVTTAQAKYASLNQNLFYRDSTGTHHLFQATGSGFLSGVTSQQFTVAGNFDWIRSTYHFGDIPFGSRTWSSVESRNHYGDPGPGLDHMVTYKITGLNTTDTVWLMFWEDLSGPLGYCDSGQMADRDFNDLVVEVRARAVPLPGAVMLGAIGLAVLSHFRRRLA